MNRLAISAALLDAGWLLREDRQALYESARNHATGKIDDASDAERLRKYDNVLASINKTLESMAPAAPTRATAGTVDRPALRIVTDDLGRALQVYVGSVEITHLVKRVQTVTELSGTQHEVVLRVFLPQIVRERVAQQEEPTV